MAWAGAAVDRHPGLELWRALHARVPAASPFVSPSWVESWLAVFGEQLRPTQLVFRAHGDEPVATCLLTPSTRRLLGIDRPRLHLNTDGEPEHVSAIIEHNHVLALPGWENAAVTAVTAWVMARRPQEFVAAGVDETTLGHLDVAMSGWLADLEWREAPFVDLDRLRSQSRTHLEVVSANTRSQLRRGLRGYNALGVLEVEVAHDSARAMEMFHELERLHSARWRTRGQLGAFASPLRRAFHHRLIACGVADGTVQLFRVAAGNRTIGVLYCLQAHRKVAFYQSGFAYGDDHRLHPGLVTHHVVIEHLRRSGYAEYDFLVSGTGEGRYKRSLATDVRRLAWVAYARPSVQSLCLQAMRRVRACLQGSMSRRAAFVPDRA